MKPPRLDKHHQKSISPRLSHPLPPPSFPGTPPRFPPHLSPPPHHFIIVSGRATRLVDTQSGRRGAMMNCSLLVLSRMIIINFPPAPAGGRGTGAGGRGPGSRAAAPPPPWAVTQLAIITYHRRSRGPRLNADENERRSFSHVLLAVYGCVFQGAERSIAPIPSPLLSSFSSSILPPFLGTLFS